VPRAISRCGRQGCDNPMPCPDHTDRGRTRSSRHSRGYDSEHERRAYVLRRESWLDDAPCSLCGDPIDYALRSPHPRSFAAHHTTDDKRGPLAPAHRGCNGIAGAPGR
jgi:hypothetical protein